MIKSIDEMAERFMERAGGSMGLALLMACEELVQVHFQTSLGYRREKQPTAVPTEKVIYGKDYDDPITDDWLESGREKD